MVKNLDEFNKPSLGTELIESLKNETKIEDIVSIIPEPIVEEKSPEIIPEPKEEPKIEQKAESQQNAYTSFIKDGVEVVDVKAVLEKAREKKVDKFGIPIQPGEHRNFDRI